MSQQIIYQYSNVPMRVPGYLSVRAAAEWLGMGERGVRHLIERRRVPSTRLGRLHFLHTRDVAAYRAVRKLRRRRAMQRTRRATAA